MNRSNFYLPAQTAVHLLFTSPIKAAKKPHQLSWVSRFKRQQQEGGGISGKKEFGERFVKFAASRNIWKNRVGRVRQSEVSIELKQLETDAP